MLRLLAPRSHDDLLARHGERFKAFILLVVGLGTIAAVLSTTSFNVAIPALGRHFALGQDQVQWAITGFMGAMTVAMLPTPWLLDHLGFRRLFLGALLVLAVASVAGCLAHSFGQVVAARVFQGAAAGCLQPLGPLAVMRLFPAGKQGKASGLLSFGIVLAPAVAPALAGALLDRYGWPSIFLLSLPACALAGVLGMIFLPAPQARPARPFDWTGLVLLATATLLLVEATAALHHSGPTAPRTWGAFLIVAVALGLFVRHARRTPAPIIPLGVFAHRDFSLGCAVSFSYGFGLYASTYLIPVFLQDALGFAAGHAGATLLPAGLALAATIPLAGRLADRVPPQHVTAAGLALFGISFGMLAWLGVGIEYAQLIAATIIGRIGLGLILPALSVATLRHMPVHALGPSSTVFSYARQVGGVLGIAIAAVFVEWRLAVRQDLPGGVSLAYSEGFVLLAGIFVLALVAALAMRTRPVASSD